MNAGYLPALAALAGSAIGGLTSVASAWLTQHHQDRANRLSGEKARRQKLYKQFIDAASKLYADALAHDQAEVSALVDVYALISRMRVVSSSAVIEKADADGRAFPAEDFDYRQPDGIWAARRAGCEDPVRAVVAGRGARQSEPFGTVEVPDDEQVRKAFDIGEAWFEFRQYLEDPFCFLPGVQSLRYFFCIPVRASDVSNRLHRQHCVFVPILVSFPFSFPRCV